MEKRALKRIAANVQTNFFYGDTMYAGTVVNISKKGMYIKTKMCPPSDSKLEMLLPFMDEVIKVPVKVCRSVKTGDSYEGMGVKVINSSQDYTEFFNSLEIFS